MAMRFTRPTLPWRRRLGRRALAELRIRTLAGLRFRLGALALAGGGKAEVEAFIGASAYAAGLREGERLAREFEVTGRNAICSAAPALVALESYEASYEARGAGPRRIELRVRSCPLRDAARESGAGAERACCEGCASFVRGLAHAVNPQAEADMSARLGHGDPECRLVVAVASPEPGPATLEVPSEIRFLSAQRRAHLLARILRAQLAESALRTGALEPKALRRILAEAGHAAGVQAGLAARHELGLGAGEPDAAEASAALHEAAGAAHRRVDAPPGRAAWESLACPFQDPESLAGGGARLCVACEALHQGVADSGGGGHAVRLETSLAMGHAACRFTVAPSPRPAPVLRVSRGWLDAGASRVALLGAETLYLHAARAFGEALEHVGRHAGSDLARRAVLARLVERDEAGLRALAQRLTEAGFGDFEVTTADLAVPRAVVACRDSFEAGAAPRGQGEARAACHLTRGMLAGFVEELTGRRGLRASETSCAALGALSCEFVVGPSG